MNPVDGQEQEEWKKTSMKGIPHTEQFYINMREGT
jgi:hypothetical protein